MIAYDDSSSPSSFALTCIFSGERTALTTKYPFLISAFAVYSPSPEDEPVTMATGLFSAFAGITFCCDDAARATTARPPRRVGVAARLPERSLPRGRHPSRRVRRRRRAERRRARVHDWLAGWCASASRGRDRVDVCGARDSGREVPARGRRVDNTHAPRSRLQFDFSADAIHTRIAKSAVICTN